MRRLGLPAVLLCSSLIALSTLRAQDTADYKANPKFQDAMKEAKLLEKQRKYVFAVDSFKKANKIAAGKDVDCLNALLDVQIKSGDYKGAGETATSLEAIASTPELKSHAESERGRALYFEAGDKKRDLLVSADAALKAALADNPRNASAMYLDGYVLARLGQMDAARDEFKACLSCISPKDPSYLRAQHFSEDPSLSLHKMAPPFTVTALDGTKFNLDAMDGRVVLIDFWATWCGPCNEELPHMKKLAKDFAGEPLVIISVSWDSDEQKWRDFINKNEMTWYQYRDADHQLATLFGIHSIPHYFTIDSDGVLTTELVGSGYDVEGRLRKLIAKAKAAKAVTAVAQIGN
jgi:thiol-disulfide isomerase/thioredoxin